MSASDAFLEEAHEFLRRPAADTVLVKMPETAKKAWKDYLILRCSPDSRDAWVWQIADPGVARAEEEFHKTWALNMGSRSLRNILHTARDRFLHHPSLKGYSYPLEHKAALIEFSSILSSLSFGSGSVPQGMDATQAQKLFSRMCSSVSDVSNGRFRNICGTAAEAHGLMKRLGHRFAGQYISQDFGRLWAEAMARGSRR